VFGAVRMREHRRTVGFQELDRRSAIAAQCAVCMREGDIESVVIAAIAQRAEATQRLGLREVAPAVLGEIVDVAIPAPGAVVAAVLQRAAATAERSTPALDARALIVEAVLHLHRQRAAE